MATKKGLGFSDQQSPISAPATPRQKPPEIAGGPDGDGLYRAAEADYARRFKGRIPSFDERVRWQTEWRKKSGAYGVDDRTAVSQLEVIQGIHAEGVQQRQRGRR